MLPLAVLFPSPESRIPCSPLLSQSHSLLKRIYHTKTSKTNSNSVLKHKAVATNSTPSKPSPCLPGKAWGSQERGERQKDCGVSTNCLFQPFQYTPSWIPSDMTRYIESLGAEGKTCSGLPLTCLLECKKLCQFLFLPRWRPCAGRGRAKDGLPETFVTLVPLSSLEALLDSESTGGGLRPKVLLY
jgi:hypothetical protein